MKIYISGSQKDLERCERWRDSAITEDWYITCDWMNECRKFKDDDALNLYECLQHAMEDREGVRQCEVFWLLLPNAGGAGCFVELGLAIQMNKIIVISGNIRRTIFEAIAKGLYHSDSDAFNSLKLLAEVL